jgi:hypothetical protein
MKKLQLLAIATVTLLAAPVASFAFHWTSLCSAGATIDEDDVGLFQFNNGSLFFESGATGTILARYNVTNTTGDETPPYTTLELGYFDDGAGSVQASLYEIDPCTGALVTVCSVTSTDSPTATCTTCTFPNTTFDFGTDLYYVRVIVTRTSTAVNPQAHTLRIY